MAIDTAEKRRSVAGVPFFIFGPGVTPTLAKDAEWRQQSGWGYSGIAVAGPISPPFLDSLFAIARLLDKQMEV